MVIVTGEAGYIGSHIVVELLNGNYEVAIVDKFCNSSISVLDRIRKITDKEFNVNNFVFSSSATSSILKLRLKDALSEIFIGNVLAGLIVSFLSYHIIL